MTVYLNCHAGTAIPGTGTSAGWERDCGPHVRGCEAEFDIRSGEEAGPEADEASADNQEA